MERVRPSCGLIGKLSGYVPLTSVEVQGHVKDLTASVSVTQRYKNTGKAPIEAVYKFPLPDGAAVCGLYCTIDGKVIEGDVKKKEGAFDTYSDAIASGSGAYLVEEERSDVFTMNVGNLGPDSAVDIRVTYVTELDLTPTGDVRVVFPTTLAPRYVSASEDGRPALDKALNPPQVHNVPYRVSMRLEVEALSAITRIESSSHPDVVVTMDPSDKQRASVELSSPKPPDGDVIITIAAAEPHVPRAYIEQDDKGNVGAVVALYPTWADDETLTRSEFLFVVDRSGSMGGTKMEQSKNALQLLLRSLPVGARFNVISFGSSFAKLFSQSSEYNDSSLKTATEHVASMRADMGGTEILQPLQDILWSEGDPAYPRQLFMLTDGEVSNTREVIKLVGQNADRARLFSVGIGSAASTALVEGIARAGGGRAKFIADAARIEPVVMRQMSRSLQPVISNVRVEWTPSSSDPLRITTPYRTRPLFKGDRHLSYLLLPTGASASAPPRSVTLTAERSRGPVSFTAQIPDRPSAGRQVQWLAARHAIRDLEDGCSALHKPNGALVDGAADDTVKKEITRLGLTYGLASKFTSFVAVEIRDGKAVNAPMELVVVPSLIERDAAPQWRGRGGPRMMMASCAAPRMLMSCRAPGPAPMMMSFGGGAVQAPAFGTAPMRRSAPMMRKAKVMAHSAVAEPDPLQYAQQMLYADGTDRATPSSQRPLDHLVVLQGADGLWPCSSDLAEIVGVSIDRITQSAPQWPLQSGVALSSARPSDALWATAIALAFLELKCSADRDEWSILGEKARRALQSALNGYQAPPSLPNSAAQAWIDLAKALLS